MRPPLRFTILGAALASAIALATAGGALAAPSTAAPPAASGDFVALGKCTTQREAVRQGRTVETLRALGDCEIDRRLAAIETLGKFVGSSRVLTTSDRAALQARLSATGQGLTELRTKIDADTTVPALEQDLPEIVREFRVYVLLARQVHLVNAADGVATAVARFDSLSPKLQARIDAAKQAGRDVAAAQAALDDMNKQVDAARKLAAPVPAAVLPLTPPQFNAGTAEAVLRDARTGLLTARADLRQARDDARAVIAALR